ncbi:hypothetical protein GWO43_31210 [candidate division KSB1 bacterium]|nr:hypothetical protein [candidate division KSB1 bacterium]NIV71087.1 hypothetical protein [Phycisphaerae bacterium]NIR72366.1 hypothetical protein [candidate division KSB1 bacterium]NIS28369.1 hypothetical protein [candidate division KSB1 bacterium]NIT75250.1 hypothetical protein [candidate division KSB1 bacterium]
MLGKIKFWHALKSVLKENIDRYPIRLLFLFMFVACLFYILVWKNAPIMVTDSSAYLRIAQDLQDNLKLDEVHGRVPGYPILLLLTNSSEEPTRFLFFTQLFLHFGAVLLLVYFLNYLTISKKIIALFLFLALIPPSVVLTAYVLTETLTQFLIIMGVVFLLLGIDKGKVFFIIISSIALSLAALVRPTFQLVFIIPFGFVILYMFLTRKARRQLILGAIIILLFPSLILGGFAWSNYKNHHFFGLTPLLGFNLSTRTARFIEELPDEYAQVRKTLIRIRDRERVAYRTEGSKRPWHNSSHNGLLYIWLTVPELQRITNIKNLPELSNDLLKLNLLLIRKAPLQYLKEVLIALPTYWLPLTTDISNFHSKIIQFFWMAIHFVAITLFFILVPLLVGCRFFLGTLPTQIKERRRFQMANDTIFLFGFLVAVTIIVYTMLVSVGVEVGNPRHRAPTDLLISFTIVLGIHFWIQMRKSLIKISSSTLEVIENGQKTSHKTDLSHSVLS